MIKTKITKTFQETQAFGENFAKQLQGGTILALYGDLGSGKTTFVQGLAKGLGIEKKIISPTFIIMRTYRTGIKNQELKIKNFYHIDLYRIQNERDVEGLGLQEIFDDPENIIAIEWPEKMGTLLPEKRIDLSFRYIDEARREITLDQRV